MPAPEPRAAPSFPLRSGGHALVEALVAQGVDLAYGVPGESYLPVLDGFVEHADRIRFVACRHEASAAFMAEADAKLTGRVGVCFVTRGPGALQAAIGVHVASQDSTPLLLCVGQVPTGHRDREAFQELDGRAVFGPNAIGLAKWVGEVPSADRLPEYVAHACRVALQGRPGPVVLMLPEDVLSAVTAAPVLPRVQPAVAWPAPGGLRELRSRLLAARRPLLVVGGSGWDAGATQALARFAENWQLPVATAFRCQDRFDHEHPNFAGPLGFSPEPPLAALLREADLLIAAPEPRQAVVHLHPGAEELGRSMRPALALQAGAAAIGRALESLTAPGELPWRGLAEAAHDAYIATLDNSPVSPLDLSVVVQTAQRLAPADTVVTNGAGNFATWVHRHWRYRTPGTQLAPIAGAMGYGVPAAVAAAIRDPQRTVLCFAGDGDFLMSGHELATARAEGVRPIVVVVDNGGYGTIRMHQERRYPGRESGTRLHNPDFAALARAYGCAAETVTTTEAFEPAFQAALAAERPTLLHLPIDPDVVHPRTTLGAIRAAALAAAAGDARRTTGDER